MANCTQIPSQKTQISEEIFPKLLERSVAVQNGKEWLETQNIYKNTCAGLRSNPADADLRLRLAELFVREARVTGEHPHYFPAALAAANRVISDIEKTGKKPEGRASDHYFRALCMRSSVELSQHDFQKALETAQKAVKINPHNAFIYGCLVDANLELGRYEKAVEMCDKMVSIRPDLRSYARVSYLREVHGDLPGAIEAMKMAVEAGFPGLEETEWARLQLGQLFAKTGQLEQAKNHFEMCLAMRENYPFAVAALADLEAQKGNFSAAKIQLNTAIEAIPEIGFYIDLAKIYQKTGEKQAFSDILPKIENMFLEDQNSGHRVGLELARFHVEMTKNAAAAQRALADELAGRPDNREVKKLQKEIEKLQKNS
jgi:tetratricopeptide (TPR) repeat protein